MQQQLISNIETYISDNSLPVSIAAGANNSVVVSANNVNEPIGTIVSAHSYTNFVEVTQPNVPKVAQVDTITLAGVPEIGDVYTVTFDSVDYSKTITESTTLSAVRDYIVGEINTAHSDVLVEAGSGNGSIVFTANVPGTALPASSALVVNGLDVANTRSAVAFDGVDDYSNDIGDYNGAPSANYTIDTVRPNHQCCHRRR